MSGAGTLAAGGVEGTGEVAGEGEGGRTTGLGGTGTGTGDQVIRKVNGIVGGGNEAVAVLAGIGSCGWTLAYRCLWVRWNPCLQVLVGEVEPLLTGACG